MTLPKIEEKLRKRRILFVDDDPEMLRLVRAKLKSAAGEWDLEFADCGPTALTILEQQRFDAVVSDIEMPAMTGVELLASVKAKYPGTVRILHSAQTSKEVSLSANESAHRYLRKPWGFKELKSTLAGAFGLQGLLDNPKVRELISRQGSLPSLPTIYQKIMAEIDAEEPSMKKVEAIIASDIALTANLLKLVNSAYFGMRRQISDPGQATRLLGLDTLRGVVLTQSIFNKFAGSVLKGFEVSELLDHSISVGRLAKRIASKVFDDDADANTDALISGMLHDVGKLLIALNMADEYARIMEDAQKSSDALWKVERRVLSVTHAEVGAYLMGLWGLPNRVVEGIGFHHEPAQLNESELHVVTCVHAANAIIHDGPFSSSEADLSYLEATGMLEVYEALQEETKLQGL